MCAYYLYRENFYKQDNTIWRFSEIVSQTFVFRIKIPRAQELVGFSPSNGKFSVYFLTRRLAGSVLAANKNNGAQHKITYVKAFLARAREGKRKINVGNGGTLLSAREKVI